MSFESPAASIMGSGELLYGADNRSHEDNAMPHQTGISVKAILLGFVVALFGALLFTLALVALEQLLNIPFFRPGTTSTLIFITFYSALFTILGGFLAARRAKDAEYLHAAVVGLLLILVQLPFLRGSRIWFDVVSLVMPIPFALLGGYLAKRKNGSIPA